MRIALVVLREDYNRQNPEGSSAEDRCYKLGHILGRAEVTGGVVKEMALNDLTISDERKQEIVSKATSIQKQGFNFRCSEISLTESFASDLSELGSLIADL